VCRMALVIKCSRCNIITKSRARRPQGWACHLCVWVAHAPTHPRARMYDTRRHTGTTVTARRTHKHKHKHRHTRTHSLTHTPHTRRTLRLMQLHAIIRTHTHLTTGKREDLQPFATVAVGAVGKKIVVQPGRGAVGTISSTHTQTRNIQTPNTQAHTRSHTGTLCGTTCNRWPRCMGARRDLWWHVVARTRAAIVAGR
jgi:hypothetical protein